MVEFILDSSGPASFSSAATTDSSESEEKKLFFASLKKKIIFFLLIVNSRKAILKVYIFFKMLFFTALIKYDNSGLCNRSAVQLWVEPDAGFTPNL